MRDHRVKIRLALAALLGALLGGGAVAYVKCDPGECGSPGPLERGDSTRSCFGADVRLSAWNVDDGMGATVYVDDPSLRTWDVDGHQPVLSTESGSGAAAVHVDRSTYVALARVRPQHTEKWCRLTVDLWP